MKSMEREIKKLLNRSSPWRLVFAVGFLFLLLPSLHFVRNYVVEPILLRDTDYSEIQKGEWLLFCKWENCIDKITPGDFALLDIPFRQEIVRKLIALPGDSIRITSSGFTYASKANHRFKEENIIIEDRNFRIPQKGDSLYLDSLSDIEFDYTLNLMRLQKIPFYVKVFPMQKNDTLPMALAGNTKIGSRPVSIRELHGLPWQELLLIANQIQMQIHSAEPVYFKREVYNLQDSSQIKHFVVSEDMFYFLCFQGTRCADSRELGFIPKSQIKGKLIYP